MTSRRLRIVFGASIFLSSLILVSAAPQNSFTQWFCRLLGINPQVYSKVTRVRGGSTIKGVNLVRLNLSNSQEQTLWKCDGCWSPSLASDGGITVLKSDGIWLVPMATTDAPKLKVAATELALILGPIPGPTPRMLVVQRVLNNSSCGFRLRVADMTSGTLSDPAESPQPCVRLPDVLKADRIHGNLVIRESNRDSQTGSRSLLKAQIDANDTHPLVFTTLVPNRHDNIDRFDSIWLDDNTVAYLTSP